MSKIAITDVMDESNPAYALWLGGACDPFIAETLCISIQTVCKWRRRNGLKSNYRKNFPELHGRFKWMYDQGYSDTEIGKACGISRNTVRSWRLRNGLDCLVDSDKTLSPRNEQLRMDCYIKGMSDREIAKVCGVKKEAIWCWRNRRGLPLKKRGKR